ncbi:MAG TPA: tricarballylate utilization 4Fe-4S protein TcuB [Usitatibacter sp.]|nr:tricarballylate utilization 4Fe-4S protein TcuB [Usitatibacter sp.]
MTHVETTIEAVRADTARMMGICNSCRYCEGYCAVFQSMERRVAFDAPALDYLANLCHHCGACLYACQYAAPHEFGVDIPRSLARVRFASYEKYAWPGAFGALYRRQGAFGGIALALSLAVFLVLAARLAGPDGLFAARPPSESFYAIFPHSLLVAMFGTVFGFAVLAIVVSAVRFRRAMGEGALAPVAAAGSAARLANLEGGGEGCYHQSGIDHPPSAQRRWLHHFTFYGFLLCFASTSLATFQHYVMEWPAPYPLASLVVILGTLGGIGLVIGPSGLLALRRSRDPDLVDPAQAPLDAVFLWMLLLVSATGILLLVLRDTAAMGLTLALHLGFVMALFVMLPYGKFIHGVYRYLALARHERERREPNPYGFSES